MAAVLAFAALVAPSGGSGAGEAADYRVTDPNASFFAAEAQPMPPEETGRPAGTRLTKSVPGCRAESLVPPIDYFVTIPAFYQDRQGWREASRPFFAFEAQATGFAADYARTRRPAYALCVVRLLALWADHDALLAFDYAGNHGQAWYAIAWSATAAGLAYSIVRAEPSLQAGQKRKVEDWLRAVVSKQISYPGNPTSCCNNHHYWRGLQAAIVGVVGADDQLFRYGVRAYEAALQDMNPDGSLPQEMKRGQRAIHYQNFAVLPLIFIAEIAARQGYDLYGIDRDGKDIHLAVDFLLSAMAEPRRVAPYTSEAQDLRFIDRRDELNWMEPYYRRFRRPEVAGWLARVRPLSHNWTGGPSSLYFAGLEGEPAAEPERAPPRQISQDEGRNP